MIVGGEETKVEMMRGMEEGIGRGLRRKVELMQVAMDIRRDDKKSLTSILMSDVWILRLVLERVGVEKVLAVLDDGELHM